MPPMLSRRNACVACGLAVTRSLEKADRRIELPDGRVAHTACTDKPMTHRQPEPNRQDGANDDRAALQDGGLFWRP